MSKIKNGGLDHGAEPFEQQQFGTAGVEWVNLLLIITGLAPLAATNHKSIKSSQLSAEQWQLR